MSSKDETPFYPPVPEAVVAQAKYAIIGGLYVYIYTFTFHLLSVREYKYHVQQVAYTL